MKNNTANTQKGASRKGNTPLDSKPRVTAAWVAKNLAAVVVAVFLLNKLVLDLQPGYNWAYNMLRGNLEATQHYARTTTDQRFEMKLGLSHVYLRYLKECTPPDAVILLPSKEAFFPETDWLNLLKIRASWGRVGNLGSIGYNYKSALLNKDTWLEQAQYGVESNLTWGNFVYFQTAMNPNLTWETSEQWDLGLDVDMFDNRLSMAFDYFDKRTFNLIQEQSMGWPTYMGLDALLVNQGEVRNRGFEAQVSWNHQVNKDWSYFVSGNFAYLKNWVSDIGVRNADGTPGVWTGDGSFRNIPYIYQTAEGEPLNSFYLIKTDGIFQSDEEAAAYVDKDGNRIQPNAQAGDLKFVDFNGDGVIDDNDRQYCGSATPKTTFSFSGGFTWKNLTVSAMFQGVGGAQAFYAGKYMLLSDVEGNFNRSNEILDAWSPTNTGSDIPRLSKNDPNSNFSRPSDWYLEDASYLRLKNLTVSYNLTDLMRKCQHFSERNSALSVYFSGENLFTITSYSGMDPECGGWDALKYPVSRVFSFGLKLTY